MNTFIKRIHLIDESLFLWLNHTQGCHYHRLLRWISKTGDGPLYLVIGILLILFNATDALLFFKVALLAYAIDVSLYLILKNSIKRNRPTDKLSNYTALITPSDKFSFPSGHTAAAFLFALLISNFYPPYTTGVFIWASLVGFSRVLLGVHFPGDIAAGALLGTSCAYLSLFIFS